MPTREYRLRHADKIRVETREQMKRWRKANPERTVAKAAEHSSKLHLSLRGRAMELWRAAKTRAAKRGHAFDLDLDWVIVRLQGTCELTGLPFEISARGSGRGSRSASIDRRDSTQGYVKANCRLIVWGINAALHNWGEDEYAILASLYLARNP